MLMNINLHGRLPENLPDKETINDILLELKDTKKLDINWISLNPTWQVRVWRANNKSFEQWCEKGEVRIMKCDFTPSFNKDWSNSQLDTIPMSTMTYKEIRYNIFRYPIRLEVKWKNNTNLNNKEWIEIMSLCNETYLRLKDYIGIDIIQDQYQFGDFNIDFVISECKVI